MTENTCSNNSCYLPQPPRDWSRVQNECSTLNDGVVETIEGVGITFDLLRKGNILQYKKNSSQLTQNQRYSKIAKGQWTNTNTTWATQNDKGYTNPNTTLLKRVGNVTNIAIDPITGIVIGPTALPVTCPNKTINVQYDSLPTTNPPTTKTNDALPATTGVPTINEAIPITPVIPESPIVIQDGGSLTCNIQENPCSSYSKSQRANKLFNPTSDSDVPGPIELLYWNDGIQTWFPRQRYIMTNSGNKWPYTTGPTNTTQFSSIRPSSPNITSVVYNTDSTITIYWTQEISCLNVNGFIIYFNDVEFARLNAITDVIEYSFTAIYGISGTIYIVSYNGNIYSDKSNEITII